MNTLLETTLIRPEYWLKYMASKLGAKLQEYAFSFDNQHGNGSIRNTFVEDGLILTRCELNLIHDLVIERKPSKKPLMMIQLYLPDHGWELEVKQRNFLVDRKLSNGMFLTTSHFPATLRIRAGVQFNYLAFVMEKEWLLNNLILEDEGFLTEKSFSKALFYLTHSNLDLLQQSKYLFDLCSSTPYQADLNIRGTSLSLIDSSFTKFKQHSSHKPYARINQQDADTVISHCEEIVNRLREKIPTLSETSALAHMSESKFNKLFKAIYGDSYFRYIREQRLIIAKEMLQSKQYSVSETGFQVGYSNLSKFSRSFKEQFGILPSEVIPA
jgi:AraC-like DNA-binding protein